MEDWVSSPKRVCNSLNRGVMDWQRHLQEGEQLLWQGRPAPRCYTFRNWRLALIGVLLFLVSSFWQMLGLQLVEDGHAWPLALIPVPLVVISFIMGPGQLLLARIKWERIFYSLTDKRLLLQHGILKNKIQEIPLGEVANWQQKKYGEQLASVRIQLNSGNKFTVLHCLEQPQNLIDRLDQLAL